MTTKIAIGGITNTTLHIESDGSMTIEEKQDAQGILDLNQQGRDHRFDARSKDGFYEEVANVPMVVYLEECRKAQVDPMSNEGHYVMEKILRDPQYANFLSAPKRRDPHVVMRGIR